MIDLFERQSHQEGESLHVRAHSQSVALARAEPCQSQDLGFMLLSHGVAAAQALRPSPTAFHVNLQAAGSKVGQQGFKSARMSF